MFFNNCLSWNELHIYRILSYNYQKPAVVEEQENNHRSIGVWVYKVHLNAP